MTTAERYSEIKKAVLRRRMARTGRNLAFLSSGLPRTGNGGFSPGRAVSFFDLQGRYVVGKIVDDDSLRVYESNVVSPWSVLYKHPVLTWEECLKVRKGATHLKPRDLVGFTRLFTDQSEGLEDEEASESDRGRQRLEPSLAS